MQKRKNTRPDARPWKAISIFALTILLGLFSSQHLVADDDDDDDDEHGKHSFERVTKGLPGQAIVFKQFESLPENPKYKAECSSCHTLYHPGLLPARSWSKIMSGLDKHFGENASLDAKDAQEIQTFLTAHAADRAASRRSRAIMDSLSSSDTPLRITETRYFKRRHHEVRASDWKLPKVGGAYNCTACHADAEKGYFNEHSVKIPR